MAPPDTRPTPDRPRRQPDDAFVPAQPLARRLGQTSLDARQLDALRAGAQARVEAGTDPELALTDLVQRGVPPHQARAWIGEAMGRRNATYRRRGVWDLVVGAVFIAVGVWLGAAMVQSARERSRDGVPRRRGGSLAIPILIAVGGALTVGRGLSRLAWGGEREHW